MKKIVTVSLVERDGIKQLDWQADQATTADLDQLISILGQFRATLEPPVPQTDPAIGVPTQAVVDPRLMLSATMDGKGILDIRHPGFGWQTYGLPPTSLQYLHQRISDLLEESARAQSGPAH